MAKTLVETYLGCKIYYITPPDTEFEPGVYGSPCISTVHYKKSAVKKRICTGQGGIWDGTSCSLEAEPEPEPEPDIAQPFGDYRGCTLLRYTVAPIYGSSCTSARRNTLDEVRADIDDLLGPEPEPAEFRFEGYSSLDPRELFPAGTSWPTMTKKYELGQTVKVCYKIKNIGDGPGRWTITVKDLDTGAVLTTWYGDLDPNYSFKTPLTGATVGKMPNKEWRLEFKVTP